MLLKCIDNAMLSGIVYVHHLGLERTSLDEGNAARLLFPQLYRG
jgi:hypothetical protein